MESLIIISIKLKYDHQTHCFKWHIDEGWNRCGAAAALSKGEGKYCSREHAGQLRGHNQFKGSVWCPVTSLVRPHKYQRRKMLKGWQKFLLCCRIVGTSEVLRSRRIFLLIVLILRHQLWYRIRTLRQGAEEKKEDSWSVPDVYFSFGPSTETIPAVLTSTGAATATSRFYFRGDSP